MHMINTTAHSCIHATIRYVEMMYHFSACFVPTRSFYVDCCVKMCQNIEYFCSFLDLPPLYQHMQCSSLPHLMLHNTIRFSLIGLKDACLKWGSAWQNGDSDGLHCGVAAAKRSWWENGFLNFTV